MSNMTKHPLLGVLTPGRGTEGLEPRTEAQELRRRQCVVGVLSGAVALALMPYFRTWLVQADSSGSKADNVLGAIICGIDGSGTLKVPEGVTSPWDVSEAITDDPRRQADLARSLLQQSADNRQTIGYKPLVPGEELRLRPYYLGDICPRYAEDDDPSVNAPRARSSEPLTRTG
jgi:hypothetical protein